MSGLLNVKGIRTLANQSDRGILSCYTAEGVSGCAALDLEVVGEWYGSGKDIN